MKKKTLHRHTSYRHALCDKITKGEDAEIAMAELEALLLSDIEEAIQ